MVRVANFFILLVRAKSMHSKKKNKKIEKRRKKLWKQYQQFKKENQRKKRPRVNRYRPRFRELKEGADYHVVSVINNRENHIEGEVRSFI